MNFIKKRAISIIRGEIKSRLPYWFWGNYLCLKIVKHGLWFYYKGDEVLYLWPWRRGETPNLKFISMLFSGNGELWDAKFSSLKEIDKTWEEYVNSLNELKNTNSDII